MKKLLTLIGLLALAGGVNAAQDRTPSVFSFSPFYAVQTDFDTARHGAGLSLNLDLPKGWQLRTEAYSFDPRKKFVDNLAVTAAIDLPFLSGEKFGLYAVGGAGHRFDAHRWDAHLGAGLRYNFTKRLSAGLESRLVTDGREHSMLGQFRLNCRF